MELLLAPIQTEASAQFVQESFGIGDQTVILEILRSKMYSDPITSICQEIMSNARDAHREVGKGHLPIKVFFPTELNPQYKIQDFGPGISPKRMKEVFLLYGNSTKRGSNLETGGFGLGGKVPFAYTDQFIIISITPDENGVMIKRTYIARIDETRLGALSLVTEEVTDEPQGLTVIISLKESDDRHQFISQTIRTGYWWEPRPELINYSNDADDDPWGAHIAEFTGRDQDWLIIDKFGIGAGAQAIIDGIPYRIDRDKLVTPQVVELKDRAIRLFFKVGQLPVTSNREALDYQPWVVELLKEKFAKIHAELLESVTVQLDAATNYRDACNIWGKLKHSSSVSWMSPKWKGLDLSMEIKIPGSSSSYDKATKTIVRQYDLEDDNTVIAQKNKERYHKESELNLAHGNLIIEDDTDSDQPSKPRILTALLHHKKDRCTIVKFRTDHHKEKIEGENKIWTLLDFPKLSSYDKTLIRRPSIIHKIREFNTNTKEWIPVDLDVANAEGTFVILNKGKYTFDLGHKDYGLATTRDMISNLRRHCEALSIKLPKLYAIMGRWVKDVGPKMVGLTEHIRNVIKPLETEEFLGLIKFNNNSSLGGLQRIVNYGKFIKGLPKDHLIVKWDNLYKKHGKQSNEVSHYVALVTLLDPQTRIVKTDLLTEIMRRYPLFALVMDYNNSYIKSIDLEKSTAFYLDYVSQTDGVDRFSPVLVR